MLKIFLHLAESLHFGRTSQACCISPSALTRTVQRLEEEVGQRLFERDNRSVTLTTAGEVFREHAMTLIDNWENALEALSIDQGELGGQVSIFCSVTAGYTLLPRLVGRFRKKYPSVNLRLETGLETDALMKVMNEEVDVTIAALPDSVPDSIEYVEIDETPLIFICAAEDKEQYLAPVWSKVPVLMPGQGLSRKRLEQWFKRRHIKPNVYAEVHGNEALISMVSMGCGISVVPQIVLEKSPFRDRIAVLDMASNLKPYRVGVCCLKKHLNIPAVKAFWEMWQLED